MVAMMQLGGFQFGLETAAYQELSRSAAWRWASQERFGVQAGQQFTGPGEETISLPGVLYPHWKGGFGQLDAMRALANGGTPLALVAGDGANLGRWVIVRVDETQAVFADGGKPRRVDFTLELRRFPDMPADTIASPAAGGVGSVAAIPAGALGPVAQTRGLALSVSGAAVPVAGSLQQADAAVRSGAAGYPDISRKALGGVQRALVAVQSLQEVANRALAAVGASGIEVSAINAAQNLATRANALLPSVTSADALVRGSAVQLEASGGSPAAAAAVQQAQAACASATALVKQSAAEAAKVTG